MRKKQAKRNFASMTDARLAAISADENDPDAKKAAGVLARRMARDPRGLAGIKAKARRGAAAKKKAAKRRGSNAAINAARRNEGAGQRPTFGRVRRGS